MDPLQRGDVARPKTGRKPGKKFATGFVQVYDRIGVRFAATSKSVEWYEMHFYNGRHFPCTIPSGHCHCCSAHNSTEPEGYFAVVIEGQANQTVFHITNHQATSMKEVPWSGGLSRLMFFARKEKDNRYSRTKISCQGPLPTSVHLPAAMDVDGFLREVWAVGLAKLRRQDIRLPVVGHIQPLMFAPGWGGQASDAEVAKVRQPLDHIGEGF